MKFGVHCDPKVVVFLAKKAGEGIWDNLLKTAKHELISCKLSLGRLKPFVLPASYEVEW